MKELKNEELKEIYGGSFSGTFISSIVRGVTFIFDLGRTLGSALVRLINHAPCSY